MGANAKLVTKSSRLVRKSKMNNSRSSATPKTPPNKTNPKSRKAIVDSGATDSLLRPSDIPSSTDIIATPNPLSVEMPNGASISAIGATEITSAGQKIHAHIFDEKELQLGLIAVADYTSQGLTVTFTDTYHSIANPDGTIISQTPKQPGSRLWPAAEIEACSKSCKTNQASATTASAALAIRNESAAEIVLWASASLGNPTASTLESACRRGYLGNYPNLTSKMIRDNWPNTLATAQGHLQMQRQGVQSTKQKQSRTKSLQTTESSPKATHTPSRAEVALFDRDGNVVFADATGRFPLVSADGKEYILIMTYKNYIKPVAFANRGADTYVKAFREGIHFFKNLGHTITSIVLDNESSAAVTKLFKDEKIVAQFVPPGIKRSNKAERAIQTFRNHFIAVLGTVNKDFPIDRWDLLLPHIETTVNLLHPSQGDDSKSAYEGIYGHKYDFLQHPMGPAGLLIYVFELPSVRDTWATHGEVGFLLGAAMDTYRSYSCLIKSTGGKRTSNTVQFFPEPLHMPGSSKEEQLTKTLLDTQGVVKGSSICKAALDKILQRIDAGLALLAAKSMKEQPKNSADGLSDEEAQGLETAKHPIRGTEHGASRQRVSKQRVPQQRVQRNEAKASDIKPKQVRKVTTLTEEPAPPKEPASATVQPGENNPLQKRRLRKKHKPFKRRPKESQFRALSPAERKDAQNAKYTERIGYNWTDIQTGEKFQITNVVMPNKDKGPGSKTPHFEFIPLPQAGLPTAEYTYDHTRCHEIMDQTGYARWGRNAFSAAIRATETHDGHPLNQRTDGKKLNLRRELKGQHSRYWYLADREEKIRLLDSGTIRPTKRNMIPRGETITYYNPQCKEKLATVDGKQFVDYRVRGTYGGNKSNYTGITSSQTAEYLTTKVLLNATLSDRLHKDPNTKFATADMVDFYLGAMLDQPGYLGMKASDFSQELIDMYSLREYIDYNGTIYFQVVKCMYGHTASGRR